MKSRCDLASMDIHGRNGSLIGARGNPEILLVTRRAVADIICKEHVITWSAGNDFEPTADHGDCGLARCRQGLIPTAIGGKCSRSRACSDHCHDLVPCEALVTVAAAPCPVTCFAEARLLAIYRRLSGNKVDAPRIAVFAAVALQRRRHCRELRRPSASSASSVARSRQISRRRLPDV